MVVFWGVVITCNAVVDSLGQFNFWSQIQVLETSVDIRKALTKMHKVEGVLEGYVLGSQLGITTMGNVTCGGGSH